MGKPRARPFGTKNGASRGASLGREPAHRPTGRAPLVSSAGDEGERGFRLAIYSRNVTCTAGHSIRLSVEWDPRQTEGDPEDYLEACPVPDCRGRVAGSLPIGANSNTLKLSLAAS
jgi:hypothetical protein